MIECNICGPTINGIRMCDVCRKEEVYTILVGSYIETNNQYLEAQVCDSCMDKISNIIYGGPD